MTDKQIIIDGVNVLNCGHYSQFEGETENACYIMQKTFIGKEEISKEYCSCETNPNCYYKQLKRKEQECEEYKQALQEIIKIAESVTGDGSKCENCETEGYCADCEDEILKQILQKCEVLDE